MDISKLTDDEILELIRETSARTDQSGNCDLGNGWQSVPCPECHGRGFYFVAKPQPQIFSRIPEPESLQLNIAERECELCHGLGYREIQTD
jgi:DnaJ-class molecular chaperone